MKNYLIVTVAAFALMFCVDKLSAEIIVNVGSATVDAGTNGVVIEVTATGDENLTSFDVPFDFGNDGFPNIAPEGLDFASITSGAPFGGTTFFNFAENLQEDLIVNDLSLAGGILLDDSPTLLFTMTFDVGSDVPGGSIFDLTIIRDDKFVINGVNDPGAGTNPVVTVNDGRITINAVPEPSSLAFVVLGLGGLALRRRR
jgi:hypothetical protein